MSAAAADQLHLVLMTSEELKDQLERALGSISFAADRKAAGPGLGRVAVVVTPNLYGQPVISHLGRVKGARARTNLDATWVLSAVKELAAPISIEELTPELGRASKFLREVTSSRRGGTLPPAASSAVRAAIQARIDNGEWPDEGTPDWMLPRIEGELRQDHTNAVGTALMFSDMNLAMMRSAPSLVNNPLASLRDTPSEPSLIDNDLHNFPGMNGVPLAEDIYRFTDREHTLDVMNVNATGIEAATGVDLIYFSHDYDCFVLVQYKRMQGKGRGRIAGVDRRLPGQLRRMVAFDALGQSAASTKDPTAYRLGPGSTFTKFAYPVVTPSRESDLTRGLYVPSELLKRLHDSDRLKGPKKGKAITHDNLRRWLSNDQFAELVRSGWVGSSCVTVQQVRAFVAANLADGRVQVIAAHTTRSLVTDETD